MTNLLQQAIDLAKAGRREEAEALLRQILAQQPDNEAAWMWLSGVTRDQAVKREALTNVLAINPHNRLAQRGLALFSDSSTGSTLPNTFGSGKPPVTGSPPGEPEPGAASPSSPQPPSSSVPTDFGPGDDEPSGVEAPPSSSTESESDFDFSDELSFEAAFPWEEPAPWEDTSTQPEVPTFSFESETETSPPEELSLDKEDNIPLASPEATEDAASNLPSDLESPPSVETDITSEPAADQRTRDVTALSDGDEGVGEDEQTPPQEQLKREMDQTEAEVRLDEPEPEPADEKKINQPDPLALAKQRQQRQQQMLIYITLGFILIVVAAVSLTILDDAVGRYTFLPAPAQLQRVAPKPQNSEATVNFKGYPGARVRIEWTQADDAETCDDSGSGLMVDFQTGETSEPKNRIFCRDGDCAYERELNQLPITNVQVTYICGQDAVITLFKAAN